MAAGNGGEAAVVEEGEGAMASEVVKVVSEAVVEKELWEAFEKVAPEAVEKKGDGATVSEVVRKLVSEGVVEKALSEAFEKVASEVVEEAVSEVVRKLVSEVVVEEALSEASEVVEETVSDALEELVLDSAEKVVSEVAEKVSEEAEEKESGRMITLKSLDGEAVKVKEASGRVSKTIGNMIDDGRGDETIPLPDMNYKTLKKVIEYCDEHANEKSDSDEHKEELKNWDKTFIDELAEDEDSLIKVIMASNYLKIDGLHNLASQCKTTEQIGKALTMEIELVDKEEEMQQEEETRPENVRVLK